VPALGHSFDQLFQLSLLRDPLMMTQTPQFPKTTPDLSSTTRAQPWGPGNFIIAVSRAGGERREPHHNNSNETRRVRFEHPAPLGSGGSTGHILTPTSHTRPATRSQIA
jgi:hypothetical protein